MDELLTTIREVQEGGKTAANWFLNHGYLLLDIQGGARSRKHPGTNTAMGPQFYVFRNPVYVLGRPDGVPPAPLMPGIEPTHEG